MKNAIEMENILKEETSYLQSHESTANKLDVITSSNNLEFHQENKKLNFYSPAINTAPIVLEHRVMHARRSSQADPNVLSKMQLIKKLASVGYPISIGNGLKVIESFVLANFLAEAGGNALAVESLFDLYMGFLSTSAASFITTIPTVMIAKAYGAGDKEQVGKIVQQAWLLSGIVSIPIIVGLSLTKPILTALNQPNELIDEVSNYATILYFGTPALMSLIVDTNFLKSISKQRLLIPLQVISCGLGLSICYVLVLGKMGFEPKGAIGIGYALTIQSWVSWALCKAYFGFSKELKPYKLFNFSFQNFQHIKKMLKDGLPLSFLSLSDQGLIFTTGIMVGMLGTSRIKINQAMTIFLKLINIPAEGIRQSMQICVSQLMGKRKYSEMRRHQYAGILFYTSISIVPLIFFSTIPYQLTEFFVHDENFEDIESFLRITFILRALSNITEACRGSISDNLYTLFDTYYPTIVQIFTTLAVILPIGYIMAFSFDLDLVGLNLASLAGASITIPVLLRRLRYRNSYIDEMRNAIIPISSESLNPLLDRTQRNNIDSSNELTENIELTLLPLNEIPTEIQYPNLPTKEIPDLKNEKEEVSSMIVSKMQQIQDKFENISATSDSTTYSSSNQLSIEKNQNVLVFSGNQTTTSLPMNHKQENKDKAKIN